MGAEMILKQDFIWLVSGYNLLYLGAVIFLLGLICGVYALYAGLKAGKQDDLMIKEYNEMINGK